MSKMTNVPVIPQMEEVEGGAACLAMVLAHFGKWLPLDQVRTACGVSRDGTNAEDLLRAAKSFGMNGRKLTLSVEALDSKAKLPLIFLRENGQWAVLCGFQKKKNKYHLIDPASGRMEIPAADMKKTFAGICLELQPGPGFVTSGKQNNLLGVTGSVIFENRRILRLVMVTGFLAAVGGILAPIFTRVFTDSILSGDRTSWYPGFLLAFAGVILFQLVASLIHQATVIRATGKIAVKSNAAYMRHLLRLPMGFFARRKVGDLANRQEENNAVAETMIGQMAPLLINLFMLLFYLIVMAQYSLILTAVGLLTILINLAIAKRLGTIRRETNATKFRDQAALNAATVTGINLIQTIKATGSENGYLERWSGYHAAMVRVKTQIMKKTQSLATLPYYLQEFSDYIVMFMGFWLIINGKLTAGLLLTVLQFMNALSQPVSQLLEAGETLEAMGSYIERNKDVMDYPEEESTAVGTDAIDTETVQKLSGNIEMSHITFGYSKYGKPLLEDFSLSLKPGKRIALVGASGSGKSTIAKLLSG
ncbi:MAG: ABC transporter transmembrane domain-containing protein, partial [Lachnospiraceae bacterium]